MERVISHIITEEGKLSFSAFKYSGFKHGNKSDCEDFSSDLSKTIIEQLHNVFTEKVKRVGQCKVAVFGAPYNKVKTASSHLAARVTELLNMYYDGTTCSFSELKIHRQHSYQQDYSAMSLEDREKSLSAETYAFVPPVKEIEEEYDYALFIDDILITGAHERRIRNLIDREQFTVPYSFCYFAYLQPGYCEPQIEDRLNNALFGPNLGQMHFHIFIIGLINRGHFLPNTRVIKRILSLDDKFQIIINEIDVFQLKMLKDYAEKNKYHEHHLYRMNYELLSHKYFIKHAKLREK